MENLTAASSMHGDDAKDTAALQGMLVRAESYLKSFSWCHGICDKYLGFGVPDVIALFLFSLKEPLHTQGVEDEWLWVVEGDLPSAYFVVDRAGDPRAALEVYCDMMDDWIEAVLVGLPLHQVFPVAATPTVEHATMLKDRIHFIRERVVPLCPS